MKKTILLIILLLSLNLQAQCLFPKGEEFNYSVKLNFIKAGKSYIKIEDITTLRGDTVYHIVSHTRTTGFLDRLFHIREHMESWTDCKGLFSRKFYKDVDEVNYEKTFVADFIYEDSVAVLKNNREEPINGPIMDWLSMIYYIRNIRMYEGQEIGMTFFDNNKFKNYSAWVSGTEIVEVDAGIFNCWVVNPSETTEKDFRHKNELTLYLSIEEPVIPVKITNKAKFGTMILELEK